MDVDHETMSHALCAILDRIGLSPAARETVSSSAMTWEILHTLTFTLTGQRACVYRFGSSCEATSTAGLQSDVDLVYIHDSPLVVSDVGDAPCRGPCFILVHDGDTAAGYTKLQCVRDGVPLTEYRPGGLIGDFLSVDKHGRVLRNNKWPSEYPTYRTSYQINGPAFTIAMSDRETPTDQVQGYRCRSWPTEAEEWLTRDRRHNWPTQDQIQQLRTLGCILVGVGHPHSPEQTTEWRVSSSLQERQLMLSLNETQRKCYVLMKVIKNDMITPHLGDSISSYHCKTILFYAIENTPAEFWVPENLVKCLLYCLDALYKCIVDGVCPSYFIPEADLFARRVHGELRQAVADLLLELLVENGMFLYRIRCDDIGMHLWESASAPEPRLPSTTATNASQIESLYTRHCEGIVVAVHEITMNITSGNTCATSIEALSDLLTTLASTTAVTEHTEEETREAIRYMLPFIHTTLASNLAARLLQVDAGSPEAADIRRAMDEHIEQATISGIISCRLKVAALHYMLAEFETCLDILSLAAEAFQPFVCNICACDSSGYIHNKYFIDKISSTHMSCSDVAKSCMSYCVTFLSSEVDVVPVALRYEMFKSAGTSAESKTWDKFPWWYEGCNVAPIVFLHYMQYLVYDKLCDVRRKRVSLMTLAKLATTDNTLRHCETAFNLLGWMFKREGDVINAAKFFLLSLCQEPVHNAAKWHIGDLYLH